MAVPEFSMTQILPHQGRLLLLDELLQRDADSITTAVTIRVDSVLCDGAAVPSWVGMEYMAQTACAYAGVARARDGQAPGISLLLGTRSYHARVPVFAVGARLLVSAKLILRDDNDLTVFDCAIHDAATGRELAAGDIKAIRPADIHELMRQQQSINETQ